MPCSGEGGDIYTLGAGEFKPQQRYREVSCAMLRGGGAGGIYALGAGEFKPQQRYREVSCAMLRGGVGAGGRGAFMHWAQENLNRNKGTER